MSTTVADLPPARLRLRLRPVRPPAPEPPRGRGWWRYAAALLLGGYLLFAHGCHGDEDTELFARALQSAGATAGPTGPAAWRRTPAAPAGTPRSSAGPRSPAPLPPPRAPAARVGAAAPCSASAHSDRPPPATAPTPPPAS